MITVDKHNSTLQQARDIYGNKNQVLVCIEELNELACALAKYPRYDNHERALQSTRKKVLEEVADVLIILNHVEAIFELSDSEVTFSIGAKLERVQRWLNDSNSMEQTTIDRETSIASEEDYQLEKIKQEKAIESLCSKCKYQYHYMIGGECYDCRGNSNFDPKER
jgi:NTP pyrophosphatase (non-canonical NTP hydrolase)